MEAHCAAFRDGGKQVVTHKFDSLAGLKITLDLLSAVPYFHLVILQNQMKLQAIFFLSSPSSFRVKPS